ncbi:MAG: hypothetical protein ACLQB4_10615 [Beijerinckiaceae bacterium]
MKTPENHPHKIPKSLKFKPGMMERFIESRFVNDTAIDSREYKFFLGMEGESEFERNDGIVETIPLHYIIIWKDGGLWNFFADGIGHQTGSILNAD